MSDEQSPQPEQGSSEVSQQDMAEDIAETIREHVPESIVRVEMQEHFREEFFQGPHPHPRLLKEYEAIFPGSAKLIFERAKQEQDFRHEMGREQARLEHRTLSFAGWQGILGQVCALLIALLAIGGGIYLLANDNNAGGLGSIISALTALVAVFVTGKLIDFFSRRADEESDSNGSSDETDMTEDSE